MTTLDEFEVFAANDWSLFRVILLTPDKQSRRELKVRALSEAALRQWVETKMPGWEIALDMNGVPLVFREPRDQR